ncbi:MAG TPA: hypothetical protein VIU29_09980, partial [Candidatus Deferrimicrobiaceae bacterium]
KIIEFYSLKPWEPFLPKRFGGVKKKSNVVLLYTVSGDRLDSIGIFLRMNRCAPFGGTLSVRSSGGEFDVSNRERIFLTHLSSCAG